MASTTTFGAQLPEEFDVKGNCDPDKLVLCPFDKNHLIRSSRFPYHLMKCRKNHPKLAMELKTCPFNARHLVPKNKLTHHTETCEDRRNVDTENDEHEKGSSKWQVPVSTWVNRNMTEDWDEEVDEAAAPFVWGVSDKSEMKPTNNLGSSFRPPNYLPWSEF